MTYAQAIDILRSAPVSQLVVSVIEREHDGLIESQRVRPYPQEKPSYSGMFLCKVHVGSKKKNPAFDVAETLFWNGEDWMCEDLFDLFEWGDEADVIGWMPIPDGIQ